MGGWKPTILGGNIGGRVESNNFGRKHWWEGGNQQFWEETLVGGRKQKILGVNIGEKVGGNIVGFHLPTNVPSQN